MRAVEFEQGDVVASGLELGGVGPRAGVDGKLAGIALSLNLAHMQLVHPTHSFVKRT